MTDKCNVIVVTHNNVGTLDNLFNGLSENRGSIAQVTIVDNASEDETVGTINRLSASTRLPVTVIENSNDGFAGGHWAARNAFERPELATLCVNPDVRLGVGVVDGMLRALSRISDAAIVTSVLEHPDGEEDSASRRSLPTFGAAAAYAILGRLIPVSARYNSQKSLAEHTWSLDDGLRVVSVEATTGALMLIRPSFRPVQFGLFDIDYWMYGEDLQLCADAQRSGLRVVLVEQQPSIHLKGASSGMPRRWRSNRAFHHAMYVYYKKNLSSSRALDLLVWVLINGRLLVSAGTSVIRRALQGQTGKA